MTALIINYRPTRALFGRMEAPLVVEEVNSTKSLQVFLSNERSSV